LAVPKHWANGMERRHMNNKADNPPQRESKRTERTVDSDQAADGSANNKTLRPVGEGPENLRQRAEWFRRRTGGDK
jgi:hypothetical protein